ncbi:MAG TPA: calcium-binding protein, partial [Brevundimonas sp.]
MPIITGTSGADTLTGTADEDTIDGLAGNDRISGGGGNDMLIGGDGFDTLNGEAGNDSIQGDTGLDFIEGGLGDDVMDGGTGGERTPQLVGVGTVVNGGDVASYRTATAGVRVDLRLSGQQDTGGAGIDTLINFEDISASDFNDVLFGNDAANLISGAFGDDQIFGLGGNDVLLSSLGNDLVDGGDGDDFIWAGQLGQQPYVNAGNDTLIGG